MNIYKVTITTWPALKIYTVAPSANKAKSNTWLEIQDVWPDIKYIHMLAKLVKKEVEGLRSHKCWREPFTLTEDERKQFLSDTSAQY